MIDLEIGNDWESFISMKRALLSMLININVENHTDSLPQDITEVAALLKTMELTCDQAGAIQFAMGENKKLQNAFIAA